MLIINILYINYFIIYEKIQSASSSQVLDNMRFIAFLTGNSYQKIYAIEKHCKVMSVEDRKIHREIHTAPLLNTFKDWLDEQAIVVLPSSPIGKAISYSLNQWRKTIRVLNDGRLELDNNLIENMNELSRQRRA